jgi:hypothetical protein
MTRGSKHTLGVIAGCLLLAGLLFVGSAPTKIQTQYHLKVLRMNSMISPGLSGDPVPFQDRLQLVYWYCAS